MAKSNIHPEMHKLLIVLPNGKTLETLSTSDKGSIYPSTSIDKHPAWTGKAYNAQDSADPKIQHLKNFWQNKK